MSRIKELFTHKKAFIGFLTAGDPHVAKTKEYILAMEKAGVDLVEIGIPFSDPIAEGYVIERANERALKAGTTTDTIFEMVQELRKETSIPLVFLTYMNPIFVYGIEKFIGNCQLSGIDGLIVPDLPFEEKDELLQTTSTYGIDLITMVSPTSHKRIATIVQKATGFIYLVSSLGVTGIRNTITTNLEDIVTQIRKKSNCNIAVGFGISTPEQVATMGKIADGVIVGSAIVKIIEEYGDMAEQPIYEYICSMRKALPQ